MKSEYWIVWCMLNAWIALVDGTPVAPRINKCCPVDQMLVPSMEGCQPRPPALASDPGWWLGADLLPPSEVRVWRPTCPWASTAVALPLPRDERTPRGRALRGRVDAEDGTLALVGGGNHTRAVTVAPEDFCADAVTNTSDHPVVRHVFLACACRRNVLPCVRKCCANGKALELRDGRKAELTCREEADASPTWNPVFRDMERNASATQSLVFYRPLLCPDALTRVVFQRSSNAVDAEGNSFTLLPDGGVQVGNQAVLFPLEHICVDRVLDGDEQVPGEREVVQVCAAANATSPDAPLVARIMLPWLIGSLCLSATVVAFVLLPRDARVLSFRLQAAQAVALLPGQAVLVITAAIPSLPTEFCYTVAFVVQFSFLAAFFWLNVMCIDIAWAFSGVRPPGERDRRKFLCYSIYAWGSPAIISAITALLEFAEGLPETLLRPNFGDRNCWFYGKMATLVYFYGPMAALLLANVCLFGYTAARILRAQKETAMLQRGESSRHAPRGDTKRLVLYLKLFCLMGVTWIFEIISWAEGSDSLYWYVTDSINMLRGVFIFILFCCKPKVMKLLNRRLKDLGLYHDGCETNVCKRWHTCSGRCCCCWGAGVEGSSTTVSHVGASGPPILERNRGSNATTSTFMSRSSGITLRNSILSKLFPNSSVSPVVNSEMATPPTSTSSPPPSSTVASDKEITSPATENGSSFGLHGEVNASSLEAPAQAAEPVTINGSSSNPE